MKQQIIGGAMATCLLCLSTGPICAENTGGSAGSPGGGRELGVVSPHSSIKNVLTESVTLDAEANSDLEWVMAHTKTNVPYVIDLRNPILYRHVMRMLRGAGGNEQSSPELFARLKQQNEPLPDAVEATLLEPRVAVAESQDVQPINYIDALHSTGERAFATSGLSSVPNGTQVTSIVVRLSGVDNNRQVVVYAANAGSTHTSGNYFQVGTSGAMPSTIQGNTTLAEGSFSYVPQDSKTGLPITTYYRATDTVNPTSGCMNLPQYCVRNGTNCVPDRYQTACTNTVDNRTPIKACWYRGSQAECDYWNRSANPTSYFFPIQGSATFDGAIFSPATGLQTIVLINPTQGGGCYLAFQQLATLGAGWSLSNDNKTINWNFPSATFPNTGSCLNYAGTTNTYLNVQVSSLVMANQTQYGTFVFTGDRSQINLPGTYIIPQMQIQNGCFAAGTAILMNDGSTRPIETVAIGDVVRTGNGEGRTVQDVTSGVEPKSMVRITTDTGRVLLLTETHPMATPAGMTMAKALTPGDVVRTEGSNAMIAAISTETYTGKVYNLRIGDEADAIAGRTLLVADGLLAGDVAAQQLIERQTVEARMASADDISHVHPDWREDFRRHQQSAQ